MHCSSGRIPLSDTGTTLLLPSHISHSRPTPIILLPWPFSYSTPNSSASKSSFKLLCRRGSRDSVADTISNFRSRIKNSSGANDNATADDIKSEGSRRNRRWKKKRGRRAWWSDNEYLDYDEEEGPAGILEEFIDSAWAFKVFLSYGWMLPLITLSLLIVSGPKAFLMAMALPFGITILTFIINKLKHFSTTGYYNNETEDDEDDVVTTEEEEFRSSKLRQKKKRKDRGGRSGYQSWVAAARRRRTNNESRSVNKNGVNDGGRRSSLSSFGGWEDLVIIAGEGSSSNGSNKETDISRKGHKSTTSNT